MSQVRADIILEFSTPNDPSQAVVGQTLSVDVLLSGLNPGDTLTFLGVDATLDAASFQLPSNLRQGTIVRDDRSFAASSFNFGADNFATASFESQIGPSPPFPLPSIDSNGVFFSFDITPTKPGISSLSFIFVGSEGRNAANFELPNARGGAPIQFNVAAVPEPGVLGLLIGCGSWLCMRRRRECASLRQN